jgi:hypothetical protein
VHKEVKVHKEVDPMASWEHLVLKAFKEQVVLKGRQDLKVLWVVKELPEQERRV